MYFYHDTGSTAMALNYTAEHNEFLREVRLRLSAAGASGTLVVALDSIEGPEHDAILLTQPMALVESLIWQPDAPMALLPGDIINVTWANAGGKTYGLDVIIE